MQRPYSFIFEDAKAYSIERAAGELELQGAVLECMTKSSQL